MLDVGCGLGGYTARLRADRPDLVVLPMDLSPAMAGAVVADIDRLPVADAAVGAVPAMHMLYHVPDIPAAVRELRRVLRPDGVALVSTNGSGDKAEVAALWRAALGDLLGTAPEYPDPAARFRLADASLLRAGFGSVTVHRFDRITVVPQPCPVIAYLDGLCELVPLPAGVTRAAFLDRVAARVEAGLPFRITNQAGIVVCRA